MKKQSIIAAAGLIALSLASTNAMAEEKAATEKCYGVAKAGKNDCASANGAHSCAGAATDDANVNEWVMVPAGLCAKLAGGSVEAPKAE